MIMSLLFQEEKTKQKNNLLSALTQIVKIQDTYKQVPLLFQKANPNRPNSLFGGRVSILIIAWLSPVLFIALHRLP